MCDHDLDTIERLRERNKTLQSKLSSAERKLGVARKALEKVSNHYEYDRSGVYPERYLTSSARIAREALAAIGKGE